MGTGERKRYTKRDIIKLVGLCMFVVLLIVAAILLMPYVIQLKDEAIRDAFREYIHSKGIGGVFILLGIQVLQVVIAIIPGEVVEVLSGLLYGTWGGYLICTIGLTIGTVIIYYTVRVLGYSVITRVVDAKKLAKYKFLHNQKRLEVIVFILFFIPGTPKDMLTYFIPFTKIKPLHFFVISTIARIPSIISSTFAGSSIGDGKWVQTIIIFAVIGAVGLLGIVFNERIINAISSKRK